MRYLVAAGLTMLLAVPELAGAAPVAQQPDVAHMVFMAPSRWNFNVSLYRVTAESQEFIGLLHKHQKLAYDAPAGESLFMVIGGENADFLEAHLDAGKTYYAFIEPRTGWIRPRYSLLAVRHGKAGAYALEDPDFPEWLSKCTAVTPSDEDRAWYDHNRPSVEKKRAAFLKKWNARDEEFKDRQRLEPADGLP